MAEDTARPETISHLYDTKRRSRWWETAPPPVRDYLALVFAWFEKSGEEPIAQRLADTLGKEFQYRISSSSVKNWVNEVFHHRPA